jgi:hypothetical protein
MMLSADLPAKEDLKPRSSQSSSGKLQSVKRFKTEI